MQFSQTAFLEHANITVENPQKIAEILCQLFDWKIRWSGGAKNNGFTVHVGDEKSYLALYTHDDAKKSDVLDYRTLNYLNHIGIVVNDINSIETRIKQAGYRTSSHGDYEPGCRFYFKLTPSLEVEVISYTSAFSADWFKQRNDALWEHASLMK